MREAIEDGAGSRGEHPARPAVRPLLIFWGAETAMHASVLLEVESRLLRPGSPSSDLTLRPSFRRRMATDPRTQPR
jgi:hypothetical protein